MNNQVYAAPINKLCVVLTCHNSKDRIELYRNVIQWWFTYTEYYIYVINSSPNKIVNLYHPRLQIYNFDQDIICQKYKSKSEKTSTYFEICSILYLIEVFPEIQNYNYIFKISGKYRLPEFSKEIEKIQFTNYDLILQSIHINQYKEQNTEIIGINGKIIKNLFTKLNLMDLYLERSIYKSIQNKEFKKIYRLDKIHIPKQYQVKRGDGSILEYL